MKTNSKEVIKKLQGHILDKYTIEDLKSELDKLNYINGGMNSIYSMAICMVQNGRFLVWYTQVQDFLNSLGINPINKEYDDAKTWELYKHLIARECEKLYNKKVVK